MNDEARCAGDAIPADCVRIEVYVAELKQLFNAIDPSPFRKRDLAPSAEEFVVGWAKETPRGALLSMLVHLDRAPGLPDEAAVLRDAIHDYFANRAAVTRRQLRELFRSPAMRRGKKVQSPTSSYVQAFVVRSHPYLVRSRMPSVRSLSALSLMKPAASFWS